MAETKDTIVETLILTNQMIVRLRLEDLACQNTLTIVVLVMLIRVVEDTSSQSKQEDRTHLSE